MTSMNVGSPATFYAGQPMSESEYLALGETPERLELFDGRLHLSTPRTPQHKFVAGELISALNGESESAGLLLVPAVNVRLQPQRILIPDLIIAAGVVDLDQAVIAADAVRLVCEIFSPESAGIDRVRKRHYYAAAGIPWYLLVEQDTGALYLHELAGLRYIERSVTEVGDVLRLTDPVVATIDPAELLPPG